MPVTCKKSRQFRLGKEIGGGREREMSWIRRIIFKQRNIYGKWEKLAGYFFERTNTPECTSFVYWRFQGACLHHCTMI